MSVIERLKKHILADGFHVVVDPKKSEGSIIVDAETGKEYLDCYSQFASQVLGWNHPVWNEDLTKELGELARTKIANSDMYSEVYCQFIEEFTKIAPDFKHFFFVEGGAVGVENALKAAFDWKCQVTPRLQMGDGQGLDVVHLKEAFHGRTGYTMSLTNTSDVKTKWFPKFFWTRVSNPKIHFPLDVERAETDEQETLHKMEDALGRGNVAAVIFEPIQGEGGDNHFRAEFFRAVRELTYKYDAMFILDEVQTGMGLTGRWWAYEHFGIVPDMITFGKKVQTCGFCCTTRIEDAHNHVFKQSGRINSTWGGNIVDMARSRVLIQTIVRENLAWHALTVGDFFLMRLRQTAPQVSNLRGRGLMIAFDLESQEKRDEVYTRMYEKGLLALKCGKKSIRFRPCLTFTPEEADRAARIVGESLI